MAFPGTLSPPLISSGWTFAQLQAGGLGGLLEAVIAAQVATANPTVAPTLAATGDGSSTLPTATYWAKVTESNAFGETLPIAGAASQAITSGTNHLTITFQTLKAGNTARNVYLSTVGSSGPFALAGTGYTAGTAVFSAPLPANSYAVAPPTVNMTAPTFTTASGGAMNIPLVQARSPKYNKMQMAWDYVANSVENFLRGEPEPFAAAMMKVRHTRAAMLCWLQALNECGTLMDANAGTMHVAQTPIGTSKTVRQWP